MARVCASAGAVLLSLDELGALTRVSPSSEPGSALHGSVVYLDRLLEVVDAGPLGRLVDVLETEPRSGRRVWK